MAAVRNVYNKHLKWKEGKKTSKIISFKSLYIISIYLLKKNFSDSFTSQNSNKIFAKLQVLSTKVSGLKLINRKEIMNFFSGVDQMVGNITHKHTL